MIARIPLATHLKQSLEEACELGLEAHCRLCPSPPPSLSKRDGWLNNHENCDRQMV